MKDANNLKIQMNYLMQVQSNKVWRMNVTTYDQEWNLLLLDNELYIGSVMCLFGLTFCVLRRRWYTIDMSILKSLVLCILIEWRSGRLSDDWLQPLPQLMIGPLPQSVHLKIQAIVLIKFYLICQKSSSLFLCSV